MKSCAIAANVVENVSKFDALPSIFKNLNDSAFLSELICNESMLRIWQFSKTSWSGEIVCRSSLA